MDASASPPADAVAVAAALPFDIYYGIRERKSDLEKFWTNLQKIHPVAVGFTLDIVNPNAPMKMAVTGELPVLEVVRQLVLAEFYPGRNYLMWRDVETGQECFKCGQSGHVWVSVCRDCLEGGCVAGGHGGGRGDGGGGDCNCYKCGQPGHISRDCTDGGGGGGRGSGRY